MKTFTNEEMSIFENIFSFFEEGEDGCVHRVKFPVKNQLSNRVTNLASLADINQKKGFKAYYFECNVNATKQYFYLAAKLRAETCKYSTGWDMASINPFIYALLSDSREMIDIYSHLDTKNNSIFHPDQRPPLKESYHLPKDARFPVLVFQHVLQKDWATVNKMFEIYQEKRKKKVSIDIDNFTFYFALRDGNTGKMKELINKYLQPRVHKGMNKNLVSEHEGRLWSHIPTRFSKLAALHGYELNIKSDLIPEYLIPVEPLEHYDDYYSFFSPDFDWILPRSFWDILLRKDTNIGNPY